jgi:hypothetical protein
VVSELGTVRSLYDTLQSDFSGLQGTLAEQQAAYEAQKAAAEKNRVLGIAEKATSGAAKPDPRYTQPAQTATPAYTPVAANQGAQSLTPGATPYGIAPINYAANMPDFMNNPVNLNVPSFGVTGPERPAPDWRSNAASYTYDGLFGTIPAIFAVD